MYIKNPKLKEAKLRIKLNNKALVYFLILILYISASTNNTAISSVTTTIIYFHNSELTKLFTIRFKLRLVMIFIIIE